VAQVDSIDATRSVHGSVVNSEGHRVALLQRDHLRARLHARPLLVEHKLAANEVLAWLGQQDRDLERKGQFAVEILWRQL
jgi:hypothetical protein